MQISLVNQCSHLKFQVKLKSRGGLSIANTYKMIHRDTEENVRALYRFALIASSEEAVYFVDNIM